MTPFIYADEWVYAKASDLQVEDFTCWRKTGKGRKRMPFLHLKAGVYDIVIDGYKVVWSFLDALLDTPPRRPFNDLMAGNMENATFVEELRWFLANSDKTLCFEGSLGKSVAVANSDKTLGHAHYVASTFNASCSDVFGLSSSFAHIIVPVRKSDGIHFVDADVLGSDPQLVFARADGVLETFVRETLCRPNYRPYRRIVFPTPTDIRPAAEQMHHRFSESDYTRTTYKHHPIKPAGMFDHEIDDYEHSIFCNGWK